MEIKIVGNYSDLSEGVKFVDYTEASLIYNEAYFRGIEMRANSNTQYCNSIETEAEDEVIRKLTNFDNNLCYQIFWED